MQEQTCDGDGYVHYLDCSDEFMGVHISQNTKLRSIWSVEHKTFIAHDDS